MQRSQRNFKDWCGGKKNGRIERVSNWPLEVYSLTGVSSRQDQADLRFCCSIRHSIVPRPQHNEDACRYAFRDRMAFPFRKSRKGLSWVAPFGNESYLTAQ